MLTLETWENNWRQWCSYIHLYIFVHINNDINSLLRIVLTKHCNKEQIRAGHKCNRKSTLCPQWRHHRGSDKYIVLGPPREEGMSEITVLHSTCINFDSLTTILVGFNIFSSYLRLAIKYLLRRLYSLPLSYNS